MNPSIHKQTLVKWPGWVTSTPEKVSDWIGQGVFIQAQGSPLGVCKLHKQPAVANTVSTTGPAKPVDGQALRWLSPIVIALSDWSRWSLQPSSLLHSFTPASVVPVRQSLIFLFSRYLYQLHPSLLAPLLFLPLSFVPFFYVTPHLFFPPPFFPLSIYQ